MYIGYWTLNNYYYYYYYLQVNLIYSWLCEGTIYLGERIMYLSFAFEIVDLKLKKLDDVLLFNNLW